METNCNFDKWVAANKDYYDYYREIYPFLQTMSLPLSYDLVLSFYNADIINRKFEPNPAMQNCYELLFTYYCENYDRSLTNQAGVNQGKTQLGYLWDSIIPGVKKTLDDSASVVSSAVNVSVQLAKYLIIAAVILLIAFAILKFKK